MAANATLELHDTFEAVVDGYVVESRALACEAAAWLVANIEMVVHERRVAVELVVTGLLACGRPRATRSPSCLVPSLPTSC